LADPAAGAPAGPRLLAEPGGDLPVDLPAQGADPNDFTDLDEVAHRLLGFQRRYEQTAVPFAWRFTRAGLERLLRHLRVAERCAAAA
jgi:hypothetical protein